MRSGKERLGMRTFCIIIGFCLVSAAMTCRAAETPPKKASAAKAEAAAVEWLDGLGDKGLVLKETSKDARFEGRKVIGRNSTMFNFSKDGWRVTLGFSDVINADTPLKTVRQRFKYVALDRLPTAGLDVPGWEIWPRTPTSSLRTGVVIVDLREGQIKVRIKTNFFALYGRDPTVLVPADAVAPKSSYFMIRRKFPLDLTLEAPLSMKTP